MDQYVYFTLSLPYYIQFRLYLVSSDLSRDPETHFCLALAFLKNDSMNQTGISHFVRSDHQITVLKFNQNRSVRKQSLSENRFLDPPHTELNGLWRNVGIYSLEL